MQTSISASLCIEFALRCKHASVVPTCLRVGFILSSIAGITPYSPWGHTRPLRIFLSALDSQPSIGGCHAAVCPLLHSWTPGGTSFSEKLMQHHSHSPMLNPQGRPPSHRVAPGHPPAPGCGGHPGRMLSADGSPRPARSPAATSAAPGAIPGGAAAYRGVCAQGGHFTGWAVLLCCQLSHSELLPDLSFPDTGLSLP